MRIQDIVLGELYRHKSSPNYGYVKPLKVLKAKQEENTCEYTVVKCEHTVNKHDTSGLIKYYKPSSIMRIGR